MNARKHGLTGREIVLPNENTEDYDAFVRAFWISWIHADIWRKRLRIE